MYDEGKFEVSGFPLYHHLEEEEEIYIMILHVNVKSLSLSLLSRKISVDGD